jgi:hypothetical protein
MEDEKCVKYHNNEASHSIMDVMTKCLPYSMHFENRWITIQMLPT